MKLTELFEEAVNPKYLEFKGSRQKRLLKKAMKKEIKHFAKMPHDDPKAYPKDWTADVKYKKELAKAGKKLPVSSHTKKYKQMFGEEDGNDIHESAVDTALKNKSEKTGIPVSILKQVWKRGAAAWRTGHRPGVTQNQWAHARVNSFLVGGPARKADEDLWIKYKEGKK